MELPEKLTKLWIREMRSTEHNLVMTDEGVVLGKMLLALFTKGNLAIDEQRILTLLSVAYSEPVTSKITDSFRNAGRCFKRCDRILAQMHLALTGLLSVDLEKVQRLFVADWATNRGVTPLQLLKIAGVLRKDDSDDEDDDDDEEEVEGGGDEEADDGSGFDAAHPRWRTVMPIGWIRILLVAYCYLPPRHF